MEPSWAVGKKVYIYGTGHMTKMAAMPIYGKNLVALGLKLYKVYINDDPGLTLTYFTARSNWVTCTFEWEKLL